MIAARFEKQLFSARGEKMTLSVDLSLPDREFCAVFGASGAGKTTLLRILAGLTQPDAGRIVVDGEVWYDSSAGINRPVQQRRIGFVFQDYALFPNMTVRQNLLFGREPGGDTAVVDQLLAMTGLTGLAGRRPATLSGGQRQRVALARALVRRPRLLLLDEPLSALDGETRARLQDELALLHREFGVTVLLVSHDLGEIFRLAQRVLVLEQGQIRRQGTPEDVFIDHRISGKFKFTGQVLAIQPNGLVYILTVLVGNHIVKVLGMADEVAAMRVGDQVRLSAKAFNPLITPLKA